MNEICGSPDLTISETEVRSYDCIIVFDGDNCLFRHEENALGCEVVCQYWKEGKCLNERCNFRHMELKKNRKVIPCYWETQPSGCRKPHCPFRHMNQKDKPPDKAKDGNVVVAPGNMVMPGTVLNVPGSAGGRSPNSGDVVVGPGPTTIVRADLNYANPSVDPIVVKFEEESDNESVPSSTPIKSASQLQSAVKTLEEIRLEHIQRQSAAYYEFSDDEDRMNNDGPFMNVASRRITVVPKFQRNIFNNNEKINNESKRTYTDFKILTLDEIRKNRKKRITDSKGDNYNEDDDLSQNKKSKSALITNCLPDSTSSEAHNDNNYNPVKSQVIKIDSNIINNIVTNDDVETTLKLSSHDDKTISFDKNDKINDTDNETRNDTKQKPIKLRRFLSKRKSNIDEDNNLSTKSNNGSKLKRIKINVSNICSTNSNIDDSNSNIYDNTDNLSNENLNSLKNVSDSDNLSVNDMDTIDILKDIDDLLNN